MNFGSITVDRVVDMENFRLPSLRGFPQLTHDAIRQHLDRLGPRFIDPQTFDLLISFHTYVIRAAGKTIVVDTCIGNDKNRPNRADWHHRQDLFLDRLDAVGVRPEDVDVVMCTHLHADHVGWNTRLVNGKWVPTFPRARYLMAEVELNHLREQTLLQGPSAFHGCYADSVFPVIQNGQAEMVGLSHKVLSGVYTEAIPGHTPGSVLIHIEDGHNHGVCTGDVIHHPFQLACPAMHTSYCEDPVLSATQRVSLCQRYVGSDTRILTAHFPDPSAGRILRDGHVFAFEFDAR